MKWLPPFVGLALLAVLAASAGGCGGSGAPSSAPPAEESVPPWFADVTTEVGLDFVHDAGGKYDDFRMPQIVGSGAAFLDFDNDGLLDIYLLQNAGPDSKSTNRLFKQLPGGKFKDVSRGSGLDVAGWNMGVAVGDVNNDGFPDVLVTQYGGVKLFLNNGNGTFTDVTKEAGLDNPAWATSAAFVDYDRDGWLDLVVVNYIDYDPSWPCASLNGTRDYCAPKTFPGRVSKLYRNLGRTADGKGVRFHDRTVESGLAKHAGPGLGILCYDFDGDGWIDLFIANDGMPNHLWINQRDGTFKEEAVKRGVAYNVMGEAQANMGVALGDVDGDGLPDLFVTHLNTETNTVWRQYPRGFYKDWTQSTGLGMPRWKATGFGAVLGDFDCDGALDVAIANGRIVKSATLLEPALGKHWGWYAERNQLFANDGKGRFRDLSPHNPAFCGAARVGRGLAVADFDNDGALDLLVTSVDGPAKLYRNVAPNRGHWLTVRAIDPTLKRDAYGATVTVTAGGRTFQRQVDPAASYLCANDARAHFGLGSAATFDEITVVWPDGTRETFAGGASDRFVELRKGSEK